MGILIETLPQLREAVAVLSEEKRISFDTETTGLYPFHGDRTFSYIFSTKAEDYYIDLQSIPKSMAIPLIQKVFNDPEKQIFGVNIIFDLCMIWADGIEPLGRFIDCPALARVEYNQHPETFLSMDYLANFYLGIPKDDSVKKYIKLHGLLTKCPVTGKDKPMYDKVPRDIMLKYGFSDGRITFNLGENLLKRINQKDEDYAPYRPPGYGKMIDVARNEVKLTSTLFDMKVGGFKIDREYIKRATIIEQKIVDETYADIRKECGEDFNFNSNDQIAKLLEDNGVKLEYKDPTPKMLERAKKWEGKGDLEKADKYRKGNPKTDAKTLEKITLPIMQNILRTKRAEKKINTYYKNFLMLADVDDVIHCGLNQETAVTGRTSSSAPNLQNLHKETWDGSPDQLLVRNSFIPFSGCKLLFCDYSQQEMYIMLDQAGEMDVINKLKSGEFGDFYLATAEVVFEKSGVRITRGQAKAIALGLAYGQGKALLAKNLGVSLQEAEAITKAFFTALPKLLKFKKDLESYAKRFGRIHLPSGRVYYVEKGYEYKALNAFVQGTAADISKKAMNDLREALRPFYTKLTFMVHDETLFNLDGRDSRKEIVEIVENCMVNAYPEKHIKLGVDFELSEGPWGQKIEYQI